MAHFDGRVAVVTGAGRGLGRAYALLLAKLGAKVCVNNRTRAKAEEVVAEILALGGAAVADSHDVAMEGELVIETTLQAYGRVDIIINNAGQLRDRTFQKMTPDEWADVIQTHLQGTFRVTHAAWPVMMKQRYGRVVMVSSSSPIGGNVGQANYSAAKGAVISLVQTLAQEGAKFGITVNALATAGLTRMTERFGTHTDYTPERTALGVAYFCHERCLESGTLHRVAGDTVFKLRWQAAAPLRYDTEGAGDERAGALLSSLIGEFHAGGAAGFDAPGASFPQEAKQATVRKLLKDAPVARASPPDAKL